MRKTFVPAPALRALLCAGVVCTFDIVASAQTVPVPWTAADIGEPSLRGSTRHASGVFSIEASGADIGQSRDQFHFVYQPVAGDVDVVARVESLAVVHQWAKAGVMIRSSLEPGAAHGSALVSAMQGVHFQRRSEENGNSASTKGGGGAAPIWVRATRVGTRVTTYWSPDGGSWSEIGSEAIALGSTAYVGLAVTSRHIGAHTLALISNVSVTHESVQSGTPAGQQSALPSGQRSLDIGAPAIQGSAAYSAGTYSIRGAGRDIWDTSDQFHFVYQPLSGDGEVVARVTSLNYTDGWAKAGVMIRESLAPEARHAMVVATPGNGYAFQRRSAPWSYSDHTYGGAGTAPGWVRLVRTGSYFEAYRSADGLSWTRIGADSIPMGETVYVGLAVTSHNTGAATVAGIDNFRVTAAAASWNQPPAVSITSPVAGTQYTAPTSITITAAATDPENRMAAVEFYAGGEWIARDSTAPYSTTWWPTATGNVTLTAVAYDADGNSTVSSEVPIAVLTAAALTTAPRLIVFTASADHTTNVSSYLLEVFAANANPASAAPVASSDLGKPAPSAGGEISVDRATFFSALAAGTYVATVSAIGPGGRTRSAPITFTR